MNSCPNGITPLNQSYRLFNPLSLAKSRARKAGKNLESLEARLSKTFDLIQPVPAFDGKKLEFVNRGRDDVLQGLDLALASLEKLKTDSNLNPDTLYQIITFTDIVQEELKNLDVQITESTFQFGHEQSPELFDMAKQYCVLHAAAACVYI